MPLPTQTFNTIDDWESWVNSNIITNGNGDISGNDGNITENAAVKFIKKSPLNWEKAQIISTGGVVVPVRPVVIFTNTTPTSLTWNDNIYNEYLFINMTGSDIPLGGSFVYYTPLGTVGTTIPAFGIINILKANNDLWVQGNSSNGGGGGTVQKQPQTYIVGTTVGAPTSGTNTWALSTFLNSWIVLIIGRSLIVDMTDAGDGAPFISKPLASSTLTINNYTFQDGDILSYILITP